MEHTTTTTQRVPNVSADTDTHMDNQKFLLAIHDKVTQNTKITEMRATDLCNSININTCVQMDRVYYVTLPEQLDDVLAQLKINHT